jgi:hypothetical protein
MRASKSGWARRQSGASQGVAQAGPVAALHGLRDGRFTCDAMAVAGRGGTQHQRAEPMAMVDAQPLGHPAAHRAPRRRGRATAPSGPGWPRHRRRIRGCRRPVAGACRWRPCPVVPHDHLVMCTEVLTHPIPLPVVAGLVRAISSGGVPCPWVSKYRRVPSGVVAKGMGGRVGQGGVGLGRLWASRPLCSAQMQFCGTLDFFHDGIRPGFPHAGELPQDMPANSR